MGETQIGAQWGAVPNCGGMAPIVPIGATTVHVCDVFLRVGQHQDITRACSALPVPEFCAAGVSRSTGRRIKVCYASCQHDACNWSRRTLHHMFDLLKRRSAYWTKEETRNWIGGDRQTSDGQFAVEIKMARLSKLCVCQFLISHCYAKHAPNTITFLTQL